MIDQQFFTKQFQKSLIEETAARLGLPPASVEKDWWVCVVLEALYGDSALHSLLTFKGGTSLSKAFGLIRRFSEDIDIVVDRRYLGFTGSRDPEMAQSRSAQKRLVDALKKSCADFIEHRIIPSLHQYLETFVSNSRCVIALDPHDQDRQTVLVSYEALFSSIPSFYIAPQVKIEMGARSGDEPTYEKNIRSMVFEVFRDRRWAYDFSVRTLDPARTFLEKACLIHEENLRPLDKQIKSRMSRHLYDLHCLYNSEIGKKAVFDRALLSRVIVNRKTYFHYPWLDYDTMKPGRFVLIPRDERIDFWRSDYDTLQKEMIVGNAPSFSEILSALRMIQNEMNAEREHS